MYKKRIEWYGCSFMSYCSMSSSIRYILGKRLIHGCSVSDILHFSESNFFESKTNTVVLIKSKLYAHDQFVFNPDSTSFEIRISSEEPMSSKLVLTLV